MAVGWLPKSHLVPSLQILGELFGLDNQQLVNGQTENLMVRDEPEGFGISAVNNVFGMYTLCMFILQWIFLFFWGGKGW